MTLLTSVKLRANEMTKKGSCPFLFPQDMQTSNLPLQRFQTASQSTAHQAGSAAPLLSPCKYPLCELLHLMGTFILPGSSCKETLQLCHQEMRCSVRKMMLLQIKLQNRVPWKSFGIMSEYSLSTRSQVLFPHSPDPLFPWRLLKLAIPLPEI